MCRSMSCVGGSLATLSAHVVMVPGVGWIAVMSESERTLGRKVELCGQGSSRLVRHK